MDLIITAWLGFIAFFILFLFILAYFFINFYNFIIWRWFWNSSILCSIDIMRVGISSIIDNYIAACLNFSFIGVASKCANHTILSQRNQVNIFETRSFEWLSEFNVKGLLDLILLDTWNGSRSPIKSGCGISAIVNNFTIVGLGYSIRKTILIFRTLWVISPLSDGLVVVTLHSSTCLFVSNVS